MPSGNMPFGKNALAQGTKKGVQPHFHRRTQAEGQGRERWQQPPAQGARTTPAATAREARVTPAATARLEPWSTGDAGATRAVEHERRRRDTSRGAALRAEGLSAAVRNRRFIMKKMWRKRLFDFECPAFVPCRVRFDGFFSSFFIILWNILHIVWGKTSFLYR